MLLPDNHIILTSIDDVFKICKPLQNLFSNPIEFTYTRLYRNKTHMRLLATRPNDIDVSLIYNQGYVYEGPLFHCDPFLFLETGVYPLGMFYSNNQYLSIMSSSFKIDYESYGGVVFLIKTNQYQEIFAFFDVDEKVKDIKSIHLYSPRFLKFFPLFKRFCLYFKDHAKHLIHEAEKYPIDLHHGVEPMQNTQGSLQQLCKEKWPIDKRAFLKEIDFRRCQFEDPAIANIIFSKREFECALALIRGETAQSTAEKLFLSRRTVETHIEELKNKLGCLNKTELKKKLLESSVLKFYQDCI